MNSCLCFLSSILTLTLFTASHAHAQNAAKFHFEPQTIDEKIQIGYGLALGDVDGDGKTDILLADKKEIVWYHNPSWKKSVIAKNLTIRDNVCIAARDLDGDGKVEIAVGANWNPGETMDPSKSGSVHYLIRPNDPTQPWESVTLPNEPTVHRMRWVRDATGAYHLVVVPLHGRGNVGGAGENKVKIYAYLPPESPRQISEWKTRLVDESLHKTHNFDVLESKSGPEKILLGGTEGALIATVPGKSQPPNGYWLIRKENQTTPEDFAGLGELRFFQGNSLHFAGIEPMHGTHLTLYNQDRKVLAANLSQGHALSSSNLFGSSDHELVVGWRGENDENQIGIKIFYQEEGKWKNHFFEKPQMACEDLKTRDLNGDGKPEIIACGRSSKNVVIYWNRSS